MVKFSIDYKNATIIDCHNKQTLDRIVCGNL